MSSWSVNTPFQRARYMLICSSVLCVLLALMINTGFIFAAMLLPLVSLGFAQNQIASFEMGERAHALGNALTSCPFNENTWSKAEWISGWKWAEQQVQK
ncbi:MAG: hypothetical protein C9356_19810 [Oleiphilus sp.]|nr:MAG: hypothetical protein C9356_19810 [Oleiphilus sp.]